MDPAPISGKRIVLGVCGGIAAYKIAGLARELSQAGADVRVVMTSSASHFVGALTFSTLTGNPVASELFPDPPPPEIPHTSLAREADLVVVAPATATIIARCALGIADDLLSALLLATKAPILMVPAMHTEMWEAEATVRNVETLQARGVRFVGPETGPLAGPDVGVGRLAEISSILDAINEAAGELQRRSDLAGLRVVVSAGGTREPIDPVRFVGNRSSGRMGYAIASEAIARGAMVTLVSGPTHLAAPARAEVVAVTTAAEMREAMLSAGRGAAVVIMAAAVADWRPVGISTRKLKKAEGPLSLELEPTQDILAELSRRRRDSQVLVGFCAETEELEERARSKLVSKSLDLVVGNLVGTDDSGFDSETNRAILVDRHGRLDRLPLVSKREVAGAILDAISERFLHPI